MRLKILIGTAVNIKRLIYYYVDANHPFWCRSPRYCNI